mmetsp:Transcript_11948/g.34527  ORF Transcript_11948/g.34527 Transcript_11948/m.34527 type:complete len:296 (+) Transcript_11948:35-922(+)
MLLFFVFVAPSVVSFSNSFNSRFNASTFVGMGLSMNESAPDCMNSFSTSLADNPHIFVDTPLDRNSVTVSVPNNFFSVDDMYWSMNMRSKELCPSIIEIAVSPSPASLTFQDGAAFLTERQNNLRKMRSSSTKRTDSDSGSVASVVSSVVFCAGSSGGGGGDDVFVSKAAGFASSWPASSCVGSFSNDAVCSDTVMELGVFCWIGIIVSEHLISSPSPMMTAESISFSSILVEESVEPLWPLYTDRVDVSRKDWSTSVDSPMTSDHLLHPDFVIVVFLLSSPSLLVPCAACSARS